MSRFGTVLVFCLACCFALAQDLTQPVTYITRAKPLRLVLLDLTKKTNAQLTCAQNIEEEPLILKLDAVPLKEAMDKIAGVLGGAWAKTDRGFQLSLGDEAKTWHEQAIQAKADGITKSINDQLKALSSHKTLDKDTATALVKVMAGDSKNPSPDQGVLENNAARTLQALSTRPVLEMLAKFNPKDLVLTRPGEQVVFASDPTPFQKPLPDIDKELAELAAGENVVADAVELSSLPAARKQQELKKHPHLDPPFAKVTVTLFDVFAYLSLYDTSGNKLGGFFANIGHDFYDPAAHRSQEQKIRNKLQTGVTLGPNAEEIVPFVVNPDRTAFRPLGEVTRQMLLSPTLVDPLAIATSDLALGFGQQMGLNVVYLPTDYGEVWAYVATRGGKTNLELLQDVLDRRRDTQLTADDGCLVGRPVDPIEALQKRIPRPAFERLLNSAAEAGYTSVDDLANFALSVGPEVDVAPTVITMEALGEQPFKWDGISDWAANAFYGTLDETQKKLAAEGTLRLDKTTLTGQQLDLLQTWLLNQRGDLAYDGSRNIDPSMVKNPIPALQQVRSQAMADGFGPGAFVEVTERSEPEFHLTRRDRPGQDWPMRVEDFAQEVALDETEKTDSGEPALKLDAVYTSQNRAVHLRVVLPNRYGEEGDLIDDRPTSKPESLSALLASLPPELRQRYDKAFAKAHASMGQSQQPTDSGQPGAPPQ